MSAATARMYQFDMAAHWGAGSRSNLTLEGDRLRMPEALGATRIPGTGPAEGGSLQAVDSCGRLVLLRSAGRVVARRLPFGFEEIGVLDGSTPVRQLVVGSTVLWGLGDGQVERYGATDLQLLGALPPLPAPRTNRDTTPESGWEPVAIAGDRCDGLWVFERPISATPSGPTTAGRRVRRVDQWGWPCGEPVLLDHDGTSPVLGSDPDGRWLALIDAEDTSALTVITPTDPDPVRLVPLDSIHRRARTLMAVDRSGRIQLLTPDPAHPGTARLEQLSADGATERRADIGLPRGLGDLVSMSAGIVTVVAGTYGLAQLGPCRDANRVEEATFITPPLVSPPAFQGGWNRAEIDVELPEGSAVEVTWAATSELHLVGPTTALNTVTGTVTRLVYELDGLLPWHGATARYEGGATGPGRTERLAVLIDDPASTFLWLRVRFTAPADRARPALVGLRVGYPDRSWMDHLPALYREDEVGAADLSSILAPFEILFDGLDEELSRLPARIDPETADPAWSGFLLEWLGFPPLNDLAADRRRALLIAAADLLARRGTRQALQDALDIVTGGRASVTDEAEGPDLWFLPDTTAAARLPGPRLGYDTRIAAQQPQPARAGTMTLDRTPLGRGCTDPVLTLIQGEQIVTVRLDLGPDDHTVLRPVIERLLAIFVPAHCRVRVINSGIGGQPASRRLGVDLRLGPEPGSPPVGTPTDGFLTGDTYWQLGAATRPGRWELPTRAAVAAQLDRSVPHPHERLS